MQSKVLTAVTIFAFLVTFASGQPSLPHIVEGENIKVEDGPFDEDGELYNGSVEVVGGSSDNIEMVDGGFEELLVSGAEDSFHLKFGEHVLDHHTIDFEPGGITKIEDVSFEVSSLDPHIKGDSETIEPGEEVHFEFEGSGSTGVVDYEVDMDKIGYPKNFDEPETFSETFRSEGTYEITLTIRDELGNEAVDSFPVVVESDDGSSPLIIDSEAEREGDTSYVHESFVRSSGTVNADFSNLDDNVEEIILTADDRIYDLTIKTSPIGEEPPLGVNAPERNVVHYQEINVDSEESPSIDEAYITLKIDKSALNQRDIGPERVEILRFTGTHWESLDTRIAGETEDEFKFTGLTEEFSIFAVATRENPNIQVTDLSVNPHETTVPADIDIKLELTNYGGRGSSEYEIMLDDSQIITGSAELLSDETKVVEENHLISDPGNYTIQAGGQIEEVRVNEKAVPPEYTTSMLGIILSGVLVGIIALVLRSRI